MKSQSLHRSGVVPVVKSFHHTAAGFPKAPVLTVYNANPGISGPRIRSMISPVRSDEPSLTITHSAGSTVCWQTD